MRILLLGLKELIFQQMENLISIWERIGTVISPEILMALWEKELLLQFFKGQKLQILSLICILLGIVFLLLAAVTTDTACIAFKLVGNTALMTGLLQNAVTISENSRLLYFLKLSGRNSMFIYLWHVIPLMLPVANLLKIVITVVWGGVMAIVICKKNDSGLWYLLGLN